jgi:preprotein translocase subunit YajC
MKKFTYGLISLQTLLMNGLLFAEDAVEAPPRDQGFTQTLVMLAIAVVFFYFIMWRPEQKRRKALDQARGEMKKGDKVTAMGIIGTVLRVQDHSVILKIYEGKLEVLKAAITDVVPGIDEDKAEKTEV